MRGLRFAMAALVVVACSRPAPPILVPKHITVTGITPTAFELELTLDATNPNAVDIVASDVTAHIVIDKRVDVGAALTEQTVNLPANQTTEIKAAISVPWNDLVPLTALALSERRTFPYTVDGSLALGGDLLHVSVPFHMDGNVGKAQLLRATMSSIPSATAPSVSATGDASPPTPGTLPTVTPPAGRRPRPYR